MTEDVIDNLTDIADAQREKDQRLAQILLTLDLKLDRLEADVLQTQRLCDLLQFHELEGTRSEEAKSIAIRLRQLSDTINGMIK